MHEDVATSRAQVSRRRALGLGGSVGLTALLTACGISGQGGATPTAVPTTSGSAATVTPSVSPNADIKALLDSVGSCALTPEETEGPYYFDVNSIRQDLREDRPGTPLRLALRVQSFPGCEPIKNAVVEIWHCDAGGVYSGFEVASKGGAGGSKTDDGTYLRGAQVTNADGIVEFLTIYPGWYRGRTVHIHFKVHLDNQAVLTSQLFFEESVTSEVYAASPYDEHTGRETTNENDNIFDSSLVVSSRTTSEGQLGLLNIGVNA